MAQCELTKAQLEALPSVCTYCGAPATVRVPRQFSRITPLGAFSLLVLTFIMVYVTWGDLRNPSQLDVLTRLFRFLFLAAWLIVVARWGFRVRIRLDAPFCATHRNHWRRRALVRFFLCVGGLLPLIAAMAYFVLVATRPRLDRDPNQTVPFEFPFGSTMVRLTSGDPQTDFQVCVIVALVAGPLIVAMLTATLWSFHTTIRATAITKTSIRLAGLCDAFVRAVTGVDPGTPGTILKGRNSTGDVQDFRPGRTESGRDSR